MFERLPTVPRSQELIDKAFRRAAKAGPGVGYQVSMVRTAGNVISDNLANLIRKFPSLENLPPFYYELADVLVGVDKMRISLSRLDWASKQVRKISREYLFKMRNSQDMSSIRKEAFGRMASVMKSIEGDLTFLGEAREKLRRLPTIDPDLPTIIIAGYPNVGKSSFVVMVTGARPEIASYPFTTQGVFVGHFSRSGKLYQVVDTPGLLDRPISERNEIERQAVAALRHLRGVVLYIIDPSGYCGFPLDEQLRLLDDLKGWLEHPVLAVSNKCDLEDGSYADLRMSTLTGDGVEDVMQKLVSMADEG